MSETPKSISEEALPSTSAGIFPFRSGIHSNMYKSKPWTIRQYAGFGDPKDTNRRFQQLIATGATGLSVAFDLPTQMGLDPDNELARGEAGRLGVSISKLDDMRELLQDIPIEKISTSMTINATAPILLLMYQIIAEERGISLASLRGTVQNDLLKEFISRGTQVFSPDFSMRLTSNLIKYSLENLPNWNPISISGYHMEEAGADQVQEIAFTFANAIEYLKNLQGIGLEVHKTAPRFSFFFSSKVDLINEVAKFRAAREVWAKLIRYRFDCDAEQAMKLRFHCQTAGSELFAQFPELNISRVTIQALSAVFGGAQSLHTNSFDEAIGLPSTLGSTIATQSQRVILLETGLANCVDPFEGSLVVEALTEKLIEKIEKEIEVIDKLGGALAAVKLNYQKNEISRNAFQHAMNVENGNKAFGHTSQIKLDDADSINIQSGWNWTPPNLETLQLYKSSRNQPALLETLKSISTAVLHNEDLMFPIKHSLIVGATVGEIVQALKDGQNKQK
jgi:methylmalonyl-CoA mutase N-terminal domain/subunit